MSHLEYLKQSNPTVYRVLKNSYLNRKISHAYIFSSEPHTEICPGPEFLIQLLICNHNNLQESQLPNIYNYPDLQILDGKDKLLTKENLKTAILQLNVKTFTVDKPKILYLKNIEYANSQVMNALLKFLEDPTPSTYIIMTTNQIHQIIPTIKSRAVEIKMRPLLKEQLSNYLISLNYDPAISKVLATFVRSKTESIKILEQTDFLNLYQKIIKILNLSYNDHNYLMTDLLPLLNDENYFFIMNIILSFLRDIFQFKQNLEITNDNQRFLIEKYASSSFDYNQAFQLVNNFLIMQKHYVNFNLAKQAFLISLEKCYI